MPDMREKINMPMKHFYARLKVEKFDNKNATSIFIMKKKVLKIFKI